MVQLCLVLQSLVGFLQHLHLLRKPSLVQFLALQKSATWDFVEPSYQGLQMFNLLILLFLKKISIQTPPTWGVRCSQTKKTRGPELPALKIMCWLVCFVADGQTATPLSILMDSLCKDQ